MTPLPPTEAQARELYEKLGRDTGDILALTDRDRATILEALTDAYERGRRDGLELIALTMEKRGGSFLHGWIRWIRAQAGQEVPK